MIVLHVSKQCNTFEQPGNLQHKEANFRLLFGLEPTPCANHSA